MAWGWGMTEIKAEGLDEARAELAAYDAPRCGCPLGADVDEFGGTHCPECRTVDGGGLVPACPTCGWRSDFLCDKPMNHDGAHGSGYADVDPKHLRHALSVADRLAGEVARLTAERDRWMLSAENKRAERISLVDALTTIRLMLSGDVPAPREPFAGGESDEMEALNAVRSELLGYTVVCPACGASVGSWDEDRCCLTCGDDLVVCADYHSAQMLVEHLAEVESRASADVERLTAERDEARKLAPRWVERSDIAGCYRLCVGRNALPASQVSAVGARSFDAATGKGYDSLPEAARAVCARLGLPVILEGLTTGAAPDLADSPCASRDRG